MSDETKAAKVPVMRAGNDAGGADVPEAEVKRNPRTAARIGAVQALYQMDLAGTDVADVIEDFTGSRIQAADEDDLIAGADGYFFSELVRGVVRRQRELDPLIDGRLATGWRLGRIDSTLRAILRAATFELVERGEVPTRVVINEYLNIAHAFFDGDEPKVVNGVLDGLSREVRGGAPMKTADKPEKS